jgi:hypothetical protein
MREPEDERWTTARWSVNAQRLNGRIVPGSLQLQVNLEILWSVRLKSTVGLALGGPTLTQKTGRNVSDEFTVPLHERELHRSRDEKVGAGAALGWIGSDRPHTMEKILDGEAPASMIILEGVCLMGDCLRRSH